MERRRVRRLMGVIQLDVGSVRLLLRSTNRSSERHFMCFVHDR